MKIILSILMLSALSFSACNNQETNSSNHESHAAEEKADKPMEHASDDPEKQVKVVSPIFSDVHTSISSKLSAFTDQYILVKNALTNEDATTAAAEADKMKSILADTDKSLFTTAQKTEYDKHEQSLKTNAAEIAASGNDIAKQRTHFIGLSEGLYEVVKAFGAGKTLYHDYCPMARNNEGAMWLSEIKEIRNPYFGDKMMRCGSVQEMIQ